MSDALAPAPVREVRNIDLAMMSLADCPDLWTAVHAGMMHGLAPEAALDAAFGKWASENAEVVQRFGLANFYDGPHAARAFVNYSLLSRYLAIHAHETERTVKAQARIIAQQGAQIAALSQTVQQIAAVLPSLLPSES